MASNKRAGGLRQVDRADRVHRNGLAEFDGRSMALLLEQGTKRVVMRGKAAYVRDDSLGNTLQIRLDSSEPGSPAVILSEREWNGRIMPDFHYGCDFCLVVK